MPGAVLGSGSLPFSYSAFQGGLNTLDAPFLLEDNQARDLSNVQGTTAGAITKREGLVTFASPAQALTSLFALESVSPALLIGAGGTNLYAISTGGVISTIKTGLTSGKPWSFVSAPVVSAQGPLFGMNGVDTPVQGNAGGTLGSWTNATGAVGVPNGTMMCYTQNQVFVSGVAATPSRVFWSAIRDPTDWDPANLTGAGQLDFDPNDGQPITALAVLGPYILVAKPRKLWVITDVASPTNPDRKISDNIGIASNRSIAVGPEGLYFLAEDRGVFVTNGSKVTPLSDKIQPTLDSLQGPRSQAVGTYFNAHYYLSLPLNSTTNDTTLDYDSKLGSWWKHSFGSNQFAVWHPTAAGAELFSAKATSAIVDQCFVPNVFTDNGQPMTWVWRGPWQSPSFYRRRRFPTPYFRKRLRQIRFEGSGTVDFSVARDFVGLETLIRANALATSGGSITFGASDGTTFGADDGTTFGPATVQHARINSLGVASAFSIVFGATSSTLDQIFEYVLMLTDRRDGVVS